MKNNILTLPSAYIKGVPRGAKEVLFHLVSGCCGFLMAQTGIFGNYSPFGIAFTSALPADYILSGAVGAGAGYILTKDMDMPLRYIAALTIVTITAYSVRKSKNIRSDTLILSLCAFGAAFLSGMAVCIADGFSAGALIMYMGESLLAGGSTYFFKKSFDAGEEGIKALTGTEKSCLVITGSIFIACASGITIFSISPGRILAVMIILFAAGIWEERGGAVSGAAIGAVMSLIPGCGHLGGVYAAGGVVAGVFSGGGRFASACAFALSGGIVALASTGGENVLPTLIETAIATVIYVILPKSFFESTKKRFAVKGEEKKKSSGMRRALVMRLDVASKAMSEVSRCVDKITQGLSTVDTPELTLVYSRVETAVCRKCGLRSFCWDKNFSDTIDVFGQMTHELQKGEELTRDKLPAHFARRCIRSTALIEAMNEEYEKFTEGVTSVKKVTQVRGIVSDQFGAVADMLSSLSDEFEQARGFDRETALRARRVLERYSIVPEDICCITDPYDRMTVEVSCKKTTGKINVGTLTKELSEVCSREFAMPGVTCMGANELITFSERAVYTVDVGACQFPSSENSPCGDAYECFSDGRGREIMVISDGMGTGRRAAIDGNMASGLLSQLIKAGFGFDCSLKIVNSALLLKSEEESFATLDIVCLDLFTGKAQMFKAGAPATFVRRKGKGAKTEKPSLPAGILREVEFAKTEIVLGEGDIILMVSDGAVNGGDEWILSELELWREGTASELAEHIASQAKMRRPDIRPDDVTVTAAIIGK